MTGRRTWGWIWRGGAGTALAFFGGLAWFAVDMESMPKDPVGATDAIVVLTGGAQRLERGLALLAEGKGRKLFISGVHPGVDAAPLLRAVHADPEAQSCCIVLGYGADNTEGNARETAAWLHREGFASFRLVTANYHMRRALVEFHRVLPASIAILPVPVSPARTPGSLWPWRGWSHIVVVEYLKYLGALGRAAFVPAPAVAT
jgi:uncharacterized SAM-binding protein YcdF (DUF218 family)